jgi:SIR2-like domain
MTDGQTEIDGDGGDPQIDPSKLQGDAEVEPSLLLVGGRIKEVFWTDESTVTRDHVSSILQVQNLVVLLGAGASFHIGSPKIRDLDTTELQALVEAAGNSLDKDDLNIVKALSRGSGSHDLEGLLDNLQSAVSFARRCQLSSIPLDNGDEPTYSQESSLLALQSKINAALAHACRLPGPQCTVEDPFEAHRTFFSRLVRGRRSNLPRPKVFTTNYDLVIERSLDQLGYPYLDGFSGTVDRRLNLAYYGLDFHRVQDQSNKVLARAENTLYLHKIHGSLNWQAVQRRDPISQIETLEVVQIGSSEAGKAGSVLIYPTAAKEGDTLSYPYADLLRLLSNSLQDADTAVICVGYGFWDAHINRILLGAMAMNPAINLLVADPLAVVEAREERPTSSSVGKTLQEAGITAKETPIAALAQQHDSRISVLTGSAGQFVELAKLLPDPAIAADVTTPAGIVQLIQSLGLGAEVRPTDETFMEATHG